MKLFKKLMAVALVGVMALTLLAGCATPVNKNELVNIMNDSKVYESRYGIKTVEEGSNALAKEVAQKAKTYVENHNNSTAETAFFYAQNASNDIAGIRSIVPKDTEDAYYLAYTRVTKLQSEEYKSNPATLAMRSLSNLYSLNDVNKAKLGDKAVASITTQKIGDYDYMIVVLVQAKK